MAEVVIKYEVPAAIQTYLSTDLNALADNDSFIGAKIDNGANGENAMYIALELTLAEQAGARDGPVNVYLVASLDDTNFSYGDSAFLLDAGTLIESFALDAAVTARIVVRTNIRIPPLDFKLILSNVSGQAFAATGNTLKYRIYSHESQ